MWSLTTLEYSAHFVDVIKFRTASWKFLTMTIYSIKLWYILPLFAATNSPPNLFFFIHAASVGCVGWSFADCARSSSGWWRRAVGEIKERFLIIFIAVFTLHSQHQDGMAASGTAITFLLDWTLELFSLLSISMTCVFVHVNCSRTDVMHRCLSFCLELGGLAFKDLSPSSHMSLQRLLLMMPSLWVW